MRRLSGRNGLPGVISSSYNMNLHGLSKRQGESMRACDAISRKAGTRQARGSQACNDATGHENVVPVFSGKLNVLNSTSFSSSSDLLTSGRHAWPSSATKTSKIRRTVVMFTPLKLMSRVTKRRLPLGPHSCHMGARRAARRGQGWKKTTNKTCP